MPYKFYIAKLEQHIGPRSIDHVSGLDIIRWHRTWSSDGRHLAAAAMARAVLEAAVSFGVIARLAGCADFAKVIREARRELPRPQPRDVALDADQIVAARRAAHADGRPRHALAYALAFETTLRLWDVIGQWYPIEWHAISDVIDPASGMKWIGLKWEHIGSDNVLRYTPTKTEDTTGLAVLYSLDKAPMVMEELAFWPAEIRKGPIILDAKTGLPVIARNFRYGWRKDRKAAGIDSAAWLRDLRASGITEGRASDVSLDDAAKVAGHSTPKTTAKVYDRAVLEAADRFADARVRGRKQSGNAPGNGR